MIGWLRGAWNGLVVKPGMHVKLCGTHREMVVLHEGWGHLGDWFYCETEAGDDGFWVHPSWMEFVGMERHG